MSSTSTKSIIKNQFNDTPDNIEELPKNKNINNTFISKM